MKLNNFVDKVYCINLDRRPDRWNKMIKRFDDLDIKADRVKAFDGLDYSGDDKILNAQKATVKTHLSVIQDAIDNKYNRICIFEDDVIFCDDFNERFDFFRKNVPFNWDIMYLGCHFYCCLDPLKIKNYIYRTYNSYGCFGMIISNDNNAFKKIIERSKLKVQPIDSIINSLLIFRLNGYVFLPLHLKTDKVVSDISERDDPFSYDIVNMYYRDKVNLDLEYIKSIKKKDIFNILKNKEVL